MTRKMRQLETICVYAGCLASYNAGKIVGGWVDLDGLTEGEALRRMREVSLDMSAEPGAEEMVVMDVDAPIRVHGLRDVGKLIKLNNALQATGEALSLYIDNLGTGAFDDVDQLVEDFAEHYCGHWENGLEDYLMEHHDVLESIPEHLQFYFDWKAYTRDQGIENYWEEDGYVFLR